MLPVFIVSYAVFFYPHSSPNYFFQELFHCLFQNFINPFLLTLSPHSLIHTPDIYRCAFLRSLCDTKKPYKVSVSAPIYKPVSPTTQFRRNSPGDMYRKLALIYTYLEAPQISPLIFGLLSNIMGLYYYKMLGLVFLCFSTHSISRPRQVSCGLLVSWQ